MVSLPLKHDISIHVLREEDDDHAGDPVRLVLISIHVLREEDDSKCDGK